jgi:thiamine pyrophosphokinase
MIHHPARKDYTDLELALLHARSLGVEDILVFGGLGARWDQTLANLLLPASIGLMDTKIHLVDDRQVLTMLHGSENHTILGEPGDVVSLIPISGDSHGVTTQGLEYPLDAETLHFGATRSISNTLIDRRASVSLQQGALLCVVIHLDQKA